MVVSARDVLNIAAKEIGYSVHRGSPSKYGRWYDEPGFDTAPWCFMFVSWAFYQAGLPLPPIQNELGAAYCPYGVNWFRKEGRLFKTPKVGDIVFFDWGRDGLSDHVGIVEQVYPTYIKTIEGNTSIKNQSNGNQVMRRTRYYPSCCGFARPDYDPKSISIDWDGFYLELTSPYTKNEQVMAVQKLLKVKGYDLGLDGVYGPITIQAVTDFQIKNQLITDGVVGPETWSHLIK